MATGFDRLRVGVALGAVSTLALGVARTARAAGTMLPQSLIHTRVFGSPTNASRFIYHVASTSAGPFGPSRAFGLSDASIVYNGNTCNFTNCHHTTKTSGDAFDGAGELTVGGVVFKTPSGTVDRSTDSAGNHVIKTPSVMMHGFRVRVSHTLLEGRSALRLLYSFTNTSSSTKHLHAQIGTDFGDDSGVSIFSSSDGNQTVENHDSWFTVTQPSRPNLLIARGDRRGKNSDIVLAPDAHSDDSIDSFSIRVKPHRTVRLLYFIDMTRQVFIFSFPPSGTGYQTGADLASSGNLDGMSQKEIDQVVNWRIPN
jgi:hypothetical protein